VKILPVTLFMELFAAFRKSPTTIKMVPEATCSTLNSNESRLLHPVSGGHCRKSPTTEKECRNQQSDEAFGTETTSYRPLIKKYSTHDPVLYNHQCMVLIYTQDSFTITIPKSDKPVA
jgi:hypothetical protein